MNEYIDREAVNSALGDACKECLDGCEEFDGIYPDCNYCLLHGAIERIIAIPAADVEPVKRGKWELSTEGLVATCSACGTSFPCWRMWPANYCPNCGARMDGDNEHAE